MQKAKPITVFVLILFIFSACYQDITLDLQEPDIRPAVFGIARAGKPVDVIVNKSYPLLTFTDTLDQSIQTEISLFVNNKFKEQLNYQNKHYYSNYIPQVNDLLKIKFEWNGKEISAEEKVPAQIKIDSVQYLNRTSEGLNFYVHFKDNYSEKNYYAISAKYTYRDDSSKLHTSFIYSPTSKSPLIGNEEDLSDYFDSQSLLFTDTLFNGKNIALQINFGNLYLSSDETLISVKLFLESIDKDYYLYVKSFLKNQRAQNPDLFLGDAEYINVHSNINNGYGIFKVFTMDSKDITEYFR